MEFTARQIAIFLGGEVIGDMDVKINNVSKIEDGKPGTLTFLANPKYNEYIYSTQASIVLVNSSLKIEKEVAATLIKVQDSYAALAQLLEMYVQSIPKKRGIEVPSYISANSKIEADTYIGAFTYIGENVEIGKNVQIHPQCWIGQNAVIKDNTTIFAGVKIYPDTQIGQNCIIHAGTVIGSDGFGFAPQEDGIYKKIPQIGNVIIEDNVEIGANCTIDCATMGSTIIHKGVKLDNLVQVAHNTEIGQNTVMAAQSGIAGSSTVGENCVIGGQVAISGHLKVGNKVTIGGKTGVTSNTPDNSFLLGNYGFDATKFRKAYAVFRNLPEIYRDLNHIKRDLKKSATEENSNI